MKKITVQKIISILKSVGLPYLAGNEYYGGNRRGFRVGNRFDGKEIRIAFSFSNQTTWEEAVDLVCKAAKAIKAAGIDVWTSYNDRDIDLWIMADQTRAYRDINRMFVENEFRRAMAGAISKDAAHRELVNAQKEEAYQKRKNEEEGKLLLAKELNPSLVFAHFMNGNVDTGIKTVRLLGEKSAILALVRARPSKKYVTGNNLVVWEKVPCLELDIQWMSDAPDSSRMSLLGDGRCTIRECDTIEEGLYHFLAYNIIGREG